MALSKNMFNTVMLVSKQCKMSKYDFCFCELRSEHDLKSVEKIFVTNFNSHNNAPTVFDSSFRSFLIKT